MSASISANFILGVHSSSDMALGATNKLWKIFDVVKVQRGKRSTGVTQKLLQSANFATRHSRQRSDYFPRMSSVNDIYV